MANIPHTYVVELKPENADTPEGGFLFAEEEVADAANEMYDGFLAYIYSFITNKVDDIIKEECIAKLDEMNNILKNEENEDYEEEYAVVDIPRSKSFD